MSIIKDNIKDVFRHSGYKTGLTHFTITVVKTQDTARIINLFLTAARL